MLLATSGAFNPNLEDPVPGRMKKQLVLKIISGQQLPKPKDSMLGDRGEVLQHINASQIHILTSDIRYVDDRTLLSASEAA